MRESIVGAFAKRNLCSPLIAVIAAVLGASFLSCQAFAQDYLYAVGAPAFTSAEPVELGSVNASNGNLHLEIPIATFPERGSKPLTYKFVYDSRIWLESGGSVWGPNVSTATPWSGWRFVTSADMGAPPGNNSYVNTCTVGGQPEGDTIQDDFYWQAPDGTTHYFTGGLLQYSNNCGGTVQLCMTAGDGTGYYLVVNTSATCVGNVGHTKNMGWTVIAPDGSQVYANATPAYFEDANGNYYTRDSNQNVIDTLGRTPVTVVNNCGTNQICYNVLNSQGGTTTSQWIVTTETISVNTNFPGSNWSGPLTTIESIQLPDGTSYKFSYDTGTAPGYYGELIGITLPTNGTVSYQYSTYADSQSQNNRWVTEHTSNGASTTYILSNVGSGSQTVTVTKPSGDYKVYTFQTTYPTYTYFWVINGAWRNSVSFYSAGG
jgi:hypothetical protein